MRLILTAMLAMVVVGVSAQVQAQLQDKRDEVRAGCAVKKQRGGQCRDVGRIDHLDSHELDKKRRSLARDGFLDDEEHGRVKDRVRAVYGGMRNKYGQNWDPGELDDMNVDQINRKYQALYKQGHINDALVIIDDEGNERYFNSRREKDEIRRRRDLIYKGNRNYRILKDNGLEDYFTDDWRDRNPSEVIRFAREQRGDDFVDKRNKDASYRGQTWRERMAERYGLLDDYRRQPDAYENASEWWFKQYLEANGRIDKKDPNDWDPKRVDDNTVWRYFPGQEEEAKRRSFGICEIAKDRLIGQSQCRAFYTVLVRQGNKKRTGYENRPKFDRMTPQELMDTLDDMIRTGDVEMPVYVTDNVRRNYRKFFDLN